MRKKTTVLLAVLSLVATAVLVTGLLLTVKHEPSFYRRAELAPGKARKDLSSACFGLFVRLGNWWADFGKGEWDVAFSEAQLNSYFAEDFVRLGDAEVLRKQGIFDPRLVLEHDKLRLAFCYGSPPWSTIISYDLRLWLAPKQANVVCLEILGRHAGALPISTQSLLNEISEVAGRRGVEITWYRHDGNPVGLIRFQTDGVHSPARLRRLDVKPGVITIGGISLEPVLTNNAKKALAPIGN